MTPPKTYQLLPRAVSNCDNYGCYKFPVYGIVVITLGVIIFLLFFFTAVCCFIRCSRRKRKERERAASGNPDPLDGNFDMEEYVAKQLHATNNPSTTAGSGYHQQPYQHQFQQPTNNVYPQQQQQQQQQNYYSPPPPPTYQPPSY